MNATYLFMGIPMLMYLCQAYMVYYSAGRYGMCLALSAYALANAGLILDAKGI